MDRSLFYYLQLVTRDFINAAFDRVESADRNVAIDGDLYGVAYGLVAAEHSPKNLSIVLSGPGAGTSKLGERLFVPANQNPSLATDYLGVSTAVAGGANSKIVSVFLTFQRNNQTPRTDGNGDTVYTDQLESFAFKVVQGAEAVSPSPPALLTDGILLCDVTLVYGQTQIANANISTTRREDIFKASSGSSRVKVQQGRLKTMLTAVLDLIDFDGSGNWADGTTNPAATLLAQLDKIVSDLASTGSSDGIAKIGGKAISVGGFVVALGTLRAQLISILTQLDSSSPGADGASLIGFDGSGGYGGGTVLDGLAEVGPTASTAYSGAKTFDNITASGSNKYKLASRSITRIMPDVGQAPAAHWTFDAAGKQWVGDATASFVRYSVDVPNGATITGFKAYFLPAGGHGALPASMPVAQLEVLDNANNSSVFGTTTDTSANTGAYQAFHSITKTGLSVVVDKSTKRYAISIQDETGANSVAGLRATMVEVTFTTTAQDDGAG